MMSTVGRHWCLAIGFVGAMFVFEALVAFTSTSTSLLYHLLVTGFPALILLQAASSPTITAALSLLGVTGCFMVLYVVANYTKASAFKDKILVLAFLLASLYLFFTSLARSELSTAIALLKSFTVFSALPASAHAAALTLALQFSPPSGYGASLGLKAEFQFSSLSGNLLLASSLFLLLLGLLATLSSFLKGWSVDRKVFYITGTIASLLASFSEFLSPYSFAFRELNAGYMMLPPSLFGGDPRVEGAALLLLSIGLATLSFLQLPSHEAENLYALFAAGAYASSLVCSAVLLVSTAPLMSLLLAFKLVTGSLILLIVFVKVRELLLRMEGS